MENRNKKKLFCACSNCKNSSYCISKVSCYKLIDKQNCPQNNCYGCFNSFVQAFQCDYTSENMHITCCNQKNFCNLNSTHKTTGRRTEYSQLESNNSVIQIHLLVIPFIFLFVLGLSAFVIYTLW